MVFLAKDHKGGRTYLYLRENHRVNGKPVRKWQIKLGVEEDIRESGELAFGRKVRTKSIDFGLVATLLRAIDNLDEMSDAARKIYDALNLGQYL